MVVVINDNMVTFINTHLHIRVTTYKSIYDHLSGNDGGLYIMWLFKTADRSREHQVIFFFFPEMRAHTTELKRGIQDMLQVN